ncbi:hypothetical protein HPB50_018859 [Hyalomma asiaticum]|uniref:Uncharacterized protein n=1 Tax=Hyalomma asiaticum TaxID=266040 RepID=A0ACB7S1X0_HYAAI|nr:hypothetical protein HPB50_018859 [Hyalomma asiaticum]
MRHNHHQQQQHPTRRLRTLLMLRHGTRAATLLLLIGEYGVLSPSLFDVETFRLARSPPVVTEWRRSTESSRSCVLANVQLIKLPRLSGRLRLPFFRKDPTKPLQNGQNMETDLTNFLQNGAQPGMPTLHKLLLKQYSTPPMPGGGSAPQASHLYPSSMAPFGMPRLPAPTSVRPMGHPPPPQLPMYPMPHHMAGFHPMRPPYYPRPGGMIPGMPLPSAPYGVLPTTAGPTATAAAASSPKVNKRPGPGPNVLFADKEPQGSDGNYESGEIEDETPIIIRGPQAPRKATATHRHRGGRVQRGRRLDEAHSGARPQAVPLPRTTSAARR